MNINDVITAIQARTEFITGRPGKVGLVSHTDMRIAELNGMLELCDRLSEAGYDIPAVVYGAIINMRDKL